MNSDYCTDSCLDGYFEMTVDNLQLCGTCNDSCKTCQTSAFQCTSCNEETPFLIEEKCQKSCPTGYFEIDD